MSSTLCPQDSSDATCHYLKIGTQRIQGLEDCVAFELKGQIDTYNSGFLYQRLMQAIDEGFVNPILKLCEVDHISSSGIGVLLRVQAAAKARGGAVAIVRAHPKVQEILSVMGVRSLFECPDSTEEAVGIMTQRQRPARFLRTVRCVACNRVVSRSKPGRFRCPECDAVLEVDASGVVFLP